MWKAHFPSTYDTCNHDVNSSGVFHCVEKSEGQFCVCICVCVQGKISNRGGNKHHCEHTTKQTHTHTHTRWKSRTVRGERESPVTELKHNRFIYTSINISLAAPLSLILPCPLSLLTQCMHIGFTLFTHKTYPQWSCINILKQARWINRMIYCRPESFGLFR